MRFIYRMIAVLSLLSLVLWLLVILFLARPVAITDLRPTDIETWQRPPSPGIQQPPQTLPTTHELNLRIHRWLMTIDDTDRSMITFVPHLTVRAERFTLNYGPTGKAVVLNVQDDPTSAQWNQYVVKLDTEGRKILSELLRYLQE